MAKIIEDDSSEMFKISKEFDSLRKRAVREFGTSPKSKDLFKALAKVNDLINDIIDDS